MAAFQPTCRAPSREVTLTISGAFGAEAGWGVAVTGWEGLPLQEPLTAVTVNWYSFRLSSPVISARLTST